MSCVHDFHQCGLAQLSAINFKRYLSSINSFEIFFKKCGDMIVPINSLFVFSSQTCIFLRPVDLDKRICHIDTEVVAKAPSRSLPWLPSSSGQVCFNLCSGHWPPTGWAGAVLTSIQVSVHLVLIWLSSTTPFCYRVQNTEFQIPVCKLS